MSGTPGTEARRGTRVRIASYNTRDFLDDREAAARVIRRIDPDVLCLQEVPRHPFSGRRVRRFAAECDLSWPGGHRGSGGTTILVRPGTEVSQAWHRRLSVAILRRTRGYAAARIAVGEGPGVVVASVHLSLDAGERRAHTAQIIRELAAMAGSACPVILAGDLNELQSGSAWQLIDSRLRLISPTAPTFPARRPRSLLDVIFGSPAVTVLPHPDITLDDADVCAASDHRPVWVDVLL